MILAAQAEYAEATVVTDNAGHLSQFVPARLWEDMLMSLKPWRENVAPHPDVASGRYQQAEFAADMAQVMQGTAGIEYQEPLEFFARTYRTEGMKRLLKTALQRLGGGGGEPVVQVKTAFGGGKTHTMLDLYHVFGGKVTAEQAGVRELMEEAGVSTLPKARVAVFVGTDAGAARPRIGQRGRGTHAVGRHCRADRRA